MCTPSAVCLSLDAAGSCKLPADAAALAGKHTETDPVHDAHHLLFVFLLMLQAPASCLQMQQRLQESLRVQRSTLWWGKVLAWAPVLT
jgi:hypothetical protein